MPANEWDPTRASVLGELAEDGEKTMSEAIIAIPYFYDSETDKMRAMTLKAPRFTWSKNQRSSVKLLQSILSRRR